MSFVYGCIIVHKFWTVKGIIQKMCIINRIINLSKQANISQKELTEKLNCSKSSISNWKNKTSKPTIEQLIKLSTIFNVSLDYLILGIKTNNISEKEQELLKNYNKADKTTQEIVDKILNIKSKTNFKYSSLKEENKLA